MNTIENNICKLEKCSPNAKFFCLDNWVPNDPDPQPGLRWDCYNRVPTQKEYAIPFDLTTCTNNNDWVRTTL